MTKLMFGDFDTPSLLDSPTDLISCKSLRESRSSTSGFEEDEPKESIEISEEERKRIRNTEAARRCREKVKKRTIELETELRDLTRANSAMHHTRKNLLSQIIQQIEELKGIVKKNPSAYAIASRDSMIIVNEYVQAVRQKRRKIDEEYFKDSF